MAESEQKTAKAEVNPTGQTTAMPETPPTTSEEPVGPVMPQAEEKSEAIPETEPELGFSERFLRDAEEAQHEFYYGQQAWESDGEYRDRRRGGYSWDD